MFGKFFRLFFHLAVYVLIFVGLVWALLGITPKETYVRSRDNLGRIFGRLETFAGKVGETGISMKEAGKSQLQQASDRFHGKDPYEKINDQLTADVKK